MANSLENLLTTFKTGKFGSIFENCEFSTEPSDFYLIERVREALFKGSVNSNTNTALSVFYALTLCPLFDCREAQIKGFRVSTLELLSTEELLLILSACEKVNFNTSDKRINFAECENKTDAVREIKRLWSSGIIIFPSFGSGLFGVSYLRPYFSYHENIRNLAYDAIAILESRGEKVVPSGQLAYEEPRGCVVS